MEVTMKYFITGGCGFLGSNIAQRVSSYGDQVVVFDNLFRTGSEKNLKILKDLNNVTFVYGDTRNYNDVETAIINYAPDVIFHLAGQVAMTTSIANPRLDFEINTLGTINVLESIRKHVPNCIIVYSSTNKVYGDLTQYPLTENDSRYLVNGSPLGFDETTHIDMHSPYGCSKGAADQYLLDYYRIFGIRSVVLRHSTIFGINQHATYDQGWIGWFCSQALVQSINSTSLPFTVSGTGKQVRDVLFASDAVDCYLKCVENIDSTKGQAFNIGGGFDNSLSILELFGILEEELKIKLNYTQIEERISDQKVFIADITKINKFTGWAPKVSKIDGVLLMLNWIKKSSL